MSWFSGISDTLSSGWNWYNNNVISNVLPMVPIVGQGYMNQQNLKFQEQANAQNLALNKEQFEYNKALQQMIFDREDNSVQRRMSDLKAAGLSPTLAAGSGAGVGQAITSAPGQVQAKRREDQSRDVLEAITGFKTIKSLDAQIQNLQEQNSLIRAQEKESNARRWLTNAQEREATYEYNRAKPHNLPIRGTGWASELKDLLNIIKSSGATSFRDFLFGK